MPINDRPANMSQLDYLWTHFGNYKVADKLDDNPDAIVSVLALQEYLKEYTKGGLVNVELVPKTEDTLEFIGYLSNGSTVGIAEMEKEDYLIGVNNILSTIEEVDNNVCTEINIPLIVFTMKSGKKYYAQLSNYTGVETFSIITSIANNKIASQLKLDKSIENPVVDTSITEQGLRVDLNINKADKLLKLLRTNSGLDTSFTWDNEDNIEFKTLNLNLYSLLETPTQGTIYFITDSKCIYLNGIKYGITNLASTSYDGLMSKEDKKALSTILENYIQENLLENYISKEDFDKAIDDIYKELSKTSDKVVDDIKAGGNVILRKDLEIPDNLPLELFSLPTPLELDMKGNEIKTAGGSYGDVVEFKKSTATLKNGIINLASNNTVNGAGIAIMAGPNNITLENMTVNSNRAILNSASNNTTIIKSGTYTSPSQAEVVYYSAGSNSKIIIEGGRFESKVEEGLTNFTLNIKDSLVKDQDVRNFIEVRGGEFVNFDPSNCNSEGPGTNFVAEGKTVQLIQEGSNIIYKVV